MGKGAVKKRKEEAKARKQQASAASTLNLVADDNEPDSSPSPSHEPQTKDTLSIPKRGRGRPWKNQAATLPPPVPHRIRSTANITPFTSNNVSETESIGNKHPIETIIKMIQQPSSASSGNAAESSDDDSDGSESIDAIDLDDGSESDSSDPVLVVRTGKSVKAAKKPKNTGRKVKKQLMLWMVCGCYSQIRQGTHHKHL